MVWFHKKIHLDSSGLLMSSIQFYLQPLLVLYGYFSHSYVLCYFGLFVIYAIVPLLDELFTLDCRNPTIQQRQILQKKNYKFQICVIVAVIIDWLAFFKYMNIIYNYEITNFAQFYYALGLIILSGHVGAMAFTFSHQIFHKQSLFHKVFGTFAMSKTLYMHFTIQHLYGHHKNVATPIDPASAQKGITLYEFVPKSIIGSWISAYNIQKQKGKQLIYNGAILSIFSSLIFSLVIFWIYNLKGLIFFLIYAFICVFYLETINYIQHYGLRRQCINGYYQKVNIRHSWNAPYRFTNYFLMKLQRHSDHHENSLKPYQILQSFQTSPQLPHGYSVMVMIAYFPKIWTKIMDPLVDAYNNKRKHGIQKTEEQKRSQDLTIECIKKGIIVTSAMLLVSVISKYNMI